MLFPWPYKGLQPAASVVHLSIVLKMITHGALAALAAVLLASTVNGQGMYSKNSAVLQVDGKSYNKLITKSNQVSVSSELDRLAIYSY